MKKFFITIFLLYITFLNNSYGEELIQNILYRNKISLNGQWEILVDMYDIGEHYERGFYRIREKGKRWERREYDFDKSDYLLVPGDWNTQREKLFLYEGSIWYHKDFLYRKKNKKRTFIYFGGANYKTDVWVNGEKVGTHVGGFSPFNFEVTDLLKDGKNDIVVRVNNGRRKDGVPALVTDWFNYGGITRDVYLVELPETFIQDYYLQLKESERNIIEGWVKLNGSNCSNSKVRIKIGELKIDKSFITNRNGFVKFELKAKPEMWSPQNPKLYKVVIESNDDRIFDYIGFRTIEVSGYDILLNRKSIFLRGICIHEEAPYNRGRAFSKEDAKVLLEWAKELNCNFVRLAHYPHNENMVRTAEKMGILVWEEIPVYWDIDFGNLNTLENARSQLKEIMSRDKNRANVIFWSVANETPITKERMKFLTELIKVIKSNDDTRLVTAALHRFYNGNLMKIEDPLAEHLDVIGVNEYLGWYVGLPSKCDSVMWESPYNKPVIISEFGAGALYGYHGDELTRWSEEYQESVYKHNLEMLSKVDFIRGISPWILKDFRSPRRMLHGIQDFYNRKGIISENGQKKKAFYILKRFYDEIEKEWTD